MTSCGSSPGISVVMPTYNRSACLQETLQTCAKFSRGLPVEFIVIDDGSRDDTPQRLAQMQDVLPNLQWRSIGNGGPGQARNLGASLARKDLILFMGDDIRPRNADFFRTHLEVHERFPKPTAAVLGKVVWTSQPGSNVNFVMEHIQGHGGQQFGYYHMAPYSWMDFRSFYTCNVSVKRAVVDDWLAEGFSPAFPIAAWEDVEFAYRMLKHYGEFGVFYAAGSVGEHHHEYSVETFMNRQTGAGMMLKVLVDLHPEVAGLLLGLGDIVDSLGADQLRDEPEVLAYATSAIEGIKGWAKLVSRTQKLGSQHWHADFLTAVFQLAFDEGVLLAYSAPTSNLTAARMRMLEKFRDAIVRSVQREILGNHQTAAPFLFTGQTLSWNQVPLKRRLRRVPGLKTMYRMATKVLGLLC